VLMPEKHYYTEVKGSIPPLEYILNNLKIFHNK